MTDWEKSVIGTVLSDPASFAAASALIPSDFSGANQIAWAEICAMSNRGQIDMRYLANQLTQTQDWTRVANGLSVQQYLAEALQYRGTDMEAYVSEVLNVSIRKSLKRSAALIAAEAENRERTIQDLLQYAEERIMSARRDRTEEGMDMADLVPIFMPRLEGYRRGTIQPAWVPKIEGIREIIQFAEKSDLIIVAGRPGDGKSMFMRYEGFHVAQQGKWAVIYNYENDPLDYVRNYIGMIAKMDTSIIRNAGQLSDQQMERIKRGAEALRGMKIKIINAIGWSASQVHAHARRLAVQYPDNIGLFGLDYIQLVSNGLTNRVDDVGMTSRTLKIMNGRLGIPVMAASQFSREIEKRSGGRTSEPVLSDLRESGSLEQDSTIVISPRLIEDQELVSSFEENVVNGRLLPRPRAIPIRFYVLKNRNGNIGVTDPVKWSRHIGTYSAILR